MRRAILLTCALLFLASATAGAVTARDIMDLKRAGLGDEVLLALIEVDGGVFSIDTATLTELKKAGVSEKVIAAMIRSGRTPPPPVSVAEPDAPSPQVVVVEHERPVVQHVVIEHERPVVQQVAVPVPVYVPVVPAGRHRSRQVDVHQPFDPSPGFGAHAPVQPRPKKAAPVYWGWGGKLRPDAWKPAPDRHDSREGPDRDGSGKDSKPPRPGGR